MELKTAAFYCLCDDFLISKGWRDDPQCTMTAAFFSGSYERSRVFFEQHGYMPAMLSKSQFSRGIPESAWRADWPSSLPCRFTRIIRQWVKSVDLYFFRYIIQSL